MVEAVAVIQLSSNGGQGRMAAVEGEAARFWIFSESRSNKTAAGPTVGCERERRAKGDVDFEQLEGWAPFIEKETAGDRAGLGVFQEFHVGHIKCKRSGDI